MTENKQKTYSVYIHTIPNGKVYVGITSRKPEKRWNYGYGYANNKHFDQAIRKYGWDSIKHEIVASGLSRSEAEKMERKFIVVDICGFMKTSKIELKRKYSNIETKNGNLK